MAEGGKIYLLGWCEAADLGLSGSCQVPAVLCGAAAFQ